MGICTIVVFGIQLNSFSWTERYMDEENKLMRADDKRTQTLIATGVSTICFGPPYAPIITQGITFIIMLLAKDNLKAVDDLQSLGTTATVLGLCLEYLLIGWLFGHESNDMDE